MGINIWCSWIYRTRILFSRSFSDSGHFKNTKNTIITTWNKFSKLLTFSGQTIGQKIFVTYCLMNLICNAMAGEILILINISSYVSVVVAILSFSLPYLLITPIVSLHITILNAIPLVSNLAHIFSILSSQLINPY